MTHPNPSTALASVTIDELVRCGVALFVASPGSRSTALVLAAAARADVDLVVSIDERSGGFHALGYAKATGDPAAVITTSGTAVANLLPAVVEAEASGTPLVVVSGDRPPEMRRVGANQTIDQPGLFGRFVRDDVELGPAERHPDAPRWWRSRIAQAMAAARGRSPAPGPVHLDVAFREPTVAVSDDGRSRDTPYAPSTSGRPGGAPWTQSLEADTPPRIELGRLVERLEGPGLVVAGSGCNGHPGPVDLGRRLGWPVLATAESGLRGRGDVVATGHHLAARLPDRPRTVLRFGAPGPSQTMASLVAGAADQIVVGDRWSDPFRVAATVVHGAIGATAEALAGEIEPHEGDDWLAWFEVNDAAVRSALTEALDTDLSEPALAHRLGTLDADVVAVASSMPIRDVEAYAFELPPIVANRGASGIDGFVSTALGMARTAGRAVALAGDLSILHDANGFLAEPRPRCVFIVADNAGGGIFSFLPQATHVGAEFERLFATPPGRSLGELAGFHRLAAERITAPSELAGAVDRVEADGGGFVIVETDRTENVRRHRELDTLAAEAVDAVG